MSASDRQLINAMVRKPGNLFSSLEDEVSEADILRWTRAVPYPPIPHDSSHIRLVHLEPGKRNKDVRVTIQPLEFSEASNYEAISYAWGEVSITEPISINGSLCQIPVNLLAFFRQRQSMLDQAPLWIDALCIDQTDHGDKKAQIMHMASIYSRCSQFTIWLGAESETSPMAVATLTRIGSMENVDHFFELKSRAREAIVQFLNRSWWTRVWIVQEVASAANPGVARIMCGKHKLPWLTMARAAHHLKNIADFHTDAEYNVNPLLELTLTLEHARNRHTSSNALDGPTLLELLVQNRERRASDPRDKVFALLGLLRSHEWQVSMEPDYQLTWEEVYRKVVVAQQSNTWSLNILRFCNPPGTIGILQSSWAPDWSQISHRRLLRAPANHKPYTASGEYVADTVIFNGKTIAAKGLLLDDIKSSFPLTQNASSDIFSKLTLLKAISDCKKCILELASTNPYGDTHAQCEAVWRTVSIDNFEASGSNAGLLTMGKSSPLSRRISLEPIPSGWKPQLPKRGSDVGNHVRAYSSSGSSHTSHHEWLPPIPNGWKARVPKKWPRGTSESMKPAIESVLLQINSPFDLAANPFSFYIPDLYQHCRPPNTPDVQSYHAFFHHTEAEILSCHVDRALFVTVNGYVGLGPGRCKSGDKVALFAGSDVPFVLETRDGRNRVYSMVGEAYVHGVMHGEAVGADGEGWGHDLIVLR